MQLSAISLQGLERAQDRFERSANRLSVAAAIPTDSVELSATAVDLLTARQDFTANLKALKVADELDKMTLDLVR